MSEAVTVQLGPLDVKLGIEVVEASVERIVATMPVEGNTQAYGRLHGGATMVLGEFCGSWAAALHADTLGKTAVGLDINGTHHRAARPGGVVTAVATPLHLGKRITSHEVQVTDDAGRLIATVRITNCLVDRREQ
jgi:uncharacterized protein (TIGR00369 family)